MVTYKQHLFVSLIEEFTLNESFSYPGKVNFLELLLEAPMDDATAEKIVSNKKRVSIYYQGDEKTKKGWYPIDPVRIDDKNKSKFLLAYIVPKDGSKPTLNYFIQRKIVNWNVLGKKDADTSDNYDKRIMKFFTDPKVPKEKKIEFKDKLAKVGVNVKKYLRNAAVAAALAGSMFTAKTGELPSSNAARKYAPQVVQLFNAKVLKNDDFTQSQLKTIGSIISTAIKNNPDSSKALYKDYPEGIAYMVQNGQQLSPKNIDKILTSNDTAAIASTLGQFNWTRNSNGDFVINDPYDFSRFKSIKTNEKDVEGLPAAAAIAKIYNNNDVSLLVAIRHYGSLKFPEKGDVPVSDIVIPKEYVYNADLNQPSASKTVAQTKSADTKSTKAAR
jgi:hypothetical protein